MNKSTFERIGAAPAGPVATIVLPEGTHTPRLPCVESPGRRAGIS